MIISVRDRFFGNYRWTGRCIDKSDSNVEIFTFVVIKLLFCHSKIFRIFIVIFIYLDFSMFTDNITEELHASTF